MSNFLAIATVTETFRQVLSPVVAKAVTGAEVKTARPNSTGTGLPAKGINLFLYQVTPNGALANFDTPTRDAGGQLLQRSQVALNLHYLLSFYGSDEDLEAQRLLGATVRTIHARPMLTRTAIRKTLDTLLAGDSDHFLKSADLADQMELVKFTLLPLTLEELSKLWSVFFQTSYVLSVAYQGTVVLIESDAKPAPSLPVARRALHVMPLRQPFIDSVSPQIVTAGASLVIHGRNLKHAPTRVLFGAETVTPAPDKVRDDAIEVTLPAALRAGVNTVRVRHELDLGTPVEPHSGRESNACAFMLQPAISASVTALTTETEGGVQLKKGAVEVTFAPKVGRGQDVELLLNEVNPPPGAAPQGYVFKAPADKGLTDPADTETDVVAIAFKIRKQHEGDYLVRARVDGAQSELEMDPASGKYVGPVVTI